MDAAERLKLSTRIRTAREEMWEGGGPGVYSVDLRTHFKLHNPEWAGDVIPEIVDGKNIADFIDPDIDARLETLEREEAELENAPMEDDWDSDLDEEEKDTVRHIRATKATAKRAAQSLRKRGTRQQLPKIATLKHRSATQIRKELDQMGYDASMVPGQKRKRRDSDNQMDVELDHKDKKRSRGAHDLNPDDDGDARRGTRTGEIYSSDKQKKKVLDLKKRALKDLAYKGMGGEADRHPAPKLVKHMIVGKRGMGKTDRR